MPFLDQPYVWTWFLIVGWTVYRLLSAFALAVSEAANLGRKPQALLLFIHLIGSGVVWGLFGALGWRMLAPQLGAGTVICFGVMAGCAGFVVGLLIEFYFLRCQHRLAVGIVTRKAATYAEQLDVGDAEQRVRAAMAMSFIGPNALFAVPQLLTAWKDRDAALRFQVAIAFWCLETDDPAIEVAMQTGLQDADPRVRVVAASVLSKRHHAAAELVLPHLREGLKMEDEAKNVAVDALAELGSMAEPAVPDLIALIGENYNSSVLARYALAKIGAPAVPALISLLKSDSKKVRTTAIETLSEIGPAAREALPDLQDLALESDKNTRMAVAAAILKIQGKD